jgi:hypothetical protein
VTVPLQPASEDPTLPPAIPPAPPFQAPTTPVAFPLGWLLDNAAPPIQYRAFVDVARIPLAPTHQFALLPYCHAPAIALALRQGADGCWGDTMLGVPTRPDGLQGVGTINAVRRLLEYGWDREAPPLVRARRTLFRLLSEDDDPSFVYELAPRTNPNAELTRRARGILREASAATLAQAGYESDPRLRGAARRILDRIDVYMRSEVSAKPWVRVGNRQVLAQEAAPPSVYALSMLAHMPLFRSEHHMLIDRIFHYISQPMPRQESAQQLGTQIVPQPHLVLGDMLPHRNAVDADVPWALTWLELMARLGFLRRSETWSKLFERFLDDRDRQGVWHPHKGTSMPTGASPYAWPSFPLEATSAGEGRWSDVTFRIGLIARLSGRPIELV